MSDDKTWRFRDVEKVICDVRQEVGTQKECITRYSFQAMGFVTIVWGLMTSKMEGNSLLFYFCNTLLVFLLLAVVRMANHKYTTINRNLGYELHLSRIKDYSNKTNEEWTQKMLEIGWEEAMCVWRFVQPAFFNYIYEPSKASVWNIFRIHKRKPSQDLPDTYYWYDTKSLLINSNDYHPGHYLRNVHWMLHTVGGFSLFIMWCFYISQVATHWPGTANYSSLLGLQYVVTPVVLIAITTYFITQIRRQGSRRIILEGELLSIQSCAVAWRLVVTCHILAVLWAFRKHGGYRYYTRYTSGLANDLLATNQFADPHKWLKKWEISFEKETVFDDLATVLSKYDKELNGT